MIFIVRQQIVKVAAEERWEEFRKVVNKLRGKPTQEGRLEGHYVYFQETVSGIQDEFS
jgi:hypothetical protein